MLDQTWKRYLWWLCFCISPAILIANNTDTLIPGSQAVFGSTAPPNAADGKALCIRVRRAGAPSNGQLGELRPLGVQRVGDGAVNGSGAAVPLGPVPQALAHHATGPQTDGAKGHCDCFEGILTGD